MEKTVIRKTVLEQTDKAKFVFVIVPFDEDEKELYYVVDILNKEKRWFGLDAVSAKLLYNKIK